MKTPVLSLDPVMKTGQGPTTDSQEPFLSMYTTFLELPRTLGAAPTSGSYCWVPLKGIANAYVAKDYEAEKPSKYHSLFLQK